MLEWFSKKKFFPTAVFALALAKFANAKWNFIWRFYFAPSSSLWRSPILVLPAASIVTYSIAQSLHRDSHFV